MKRLNFKWKINNAYLITLSAFAIIFLKYNRYISVLACFCLIVFFIWEKMEQKKYDKEWTQYIETLSLSMDHSTKQAITNLPIALCMCKTNGTITWYNKRFTALAMKKGLLGTKIQKVFEEIDMKDVSQTGENVSKRLEIGERKYRLVYYVVPTSKKDGGMVMLYFLDETRYESLRNEYQSTRTGIILVQVDSFDEILDKVEDANRPVLEAEVERQLKVWAENYDAAIRKINKDKYFVLVDEQNLEAMEDNKFSILDEIRAIDMGNSLPVTLSLGISPREETILQTHETAVSALDLALGRGGDQCVIKRNERFTFYGGKSKAVEKKTRVKARIISYALKDLIRSSDHVLIMGHTYPDLDALGAAMGAYSICRILKKPANIVMNHSNSSIDSLYDRIKCEKGMEDIFVDHEKAKHLATNNTLLIVVDTHRPMLTEQPELLDICEKIVVVDHHRRGVEFIDKSVLVYHETYASSASEMVTELIQYIADRPVLRELEAEALLAGIMLDTKNFSFKTGVRTFEAAAFLRKAGADTVEVKTFFQGDVDSYMRIAEVVKNAKIIDGKIAISHCAEQVENAKLIASKVADELLNIKGVVASFVLTKAEGGMIQISARSLGKMNVQVIMEKLGGGGHLDTAATQMNTTMEDAMDQLEDSVMEYLNEEEKER